MKRKTNFIALAVVMLVIFGIPSGADILKRDDFQDHKSWWNWEHVGGGLAPFVGNGLVTLLMQYGSASGPSDSALWDGENIYTDCTITLRARTITPMQPGTVGWGLWNYDPPWYSFDIADSQIAWFMKQYDPIIPARTWWGDWTRNADTGGTNFGMLAGYDTDAWHVYKIERSSGVVRFYIDGNLVHQYTDHLPQGLLAFHVWIDNYNYPFDPTQPIEYRTFSDPTAMVIDYIEIHNGHPGTSQSPSGALLLKDMPREMGTGESQYLWKNYNFSGPGGKAVLIVTGRAENYGAQSSDDDMRFWIDDTDMGWDTAASFNGDVLNGANKSLVFAGDFESGNHTVQIYGDMTPLLYDVTAIGSENGDIILEEALDEEAPGGNNYLWKTYAFECARDEDTVFYISATAHENGGDDDAVRVMVDDEDFGWDTDFAFRGDRLYGEAKAFTVSRYLAAGTHTLRIYADATPILHNVIIYGTEEALSVNAPPVLDAIGDRLVNEADTLMITVTATDPDNDALTYAAEGLPPGASFDPVSHVFTWTPAYDQSGVYPGIQFTVTDDGQPPLSDSETITITVADVNRPPVLDQVGDRTVDEGASLSFTVTASDPDDHALIFAAGNLPAGSDFDPVTRAFTWTPDYDQAGIYTNVLFSVTDDGNPPMSDSESITITVDDVNRPPVLDPVGDRTVDEGALLSFTIAAADPDDHTLTFSAGNLPPGSDFDAATRIFSWTPDYGQAGVYANILFSVTDNGNPPMSDSENITITVGDVNRPPVLDPVGDRAVEEEALLSFIVTASDPDDHTLTFSAGNLPPGSDFDPQTQEFNWTPGSGQAGAYPNVLFTVTDDGTPPLNDSESITITVGDVNRPPVLDPIGNRGVDEGDLLEFMVTASDPDNDDLTYAAGNLPPGALFDPDTQVFSWTPDYGHAGAYIDVLFSVTDNGAPPLGDSESITITVGDVNRPPVLDPIGNRAVDEGDLMEFTATAGDPDNDDLTYTSGNLPPGAVFDPDTQDFDWTPDYGQAGAYPDVLFSVTDDGTPPLGDSESITITVGDVNRPPVLDPIGNRAVDEGDLLEFTVTAGDPDNDDLTYTSGNLPPGAVFDPDTQVFSWTPDYGQAGAYTNVLFGVTDDGTPPLGDSESITITVGDVNRPPVLDSIGNRAVDEGDLLEFTVTAGDPDNNNLTFDSDNLPPGAVFDQDTQVFSWIPDYGQGGAYSNVLFSVTDDGTPPLGDSELITITVGDVNRPPALGPIGNQSVTEGEALTFTVTATDPDGDDLFFSSGNLPPGASFDPGTQVFDWMPSQGQAGVYEDVLFTVTDNGVPPLEDSENITITVLASTMTITLTGPAYTEDNVLGNNNYRYLNFGGSPTNYAVGSVAGPGIRARAMIRWNLSDIPAGSQIIRADMYLYSYRNFLGGAITIRVHRLLRNWVEGTLDSRNRQQDTPWSSCWQEYGHGNAWSVGGAGGLNDTDPVVRASATGSGVGWYGWDITETVQSWVDGTWPNHGLIMASDNETANNLKYFSTSEYPDENFRPRLVIEYTLP